MNNFGLELLPNIFYIFLRMLQCELSKIPFIRIIVPLALGIIFNIYLKVDPPVYLFLIFFAFFLLLSFFISWHYKYKRQWFNGMLIYLLLMYMGMIYPHIIRDQRYPGVPGQKQIITINLTDIPVSKKNTKRVQAKVHAVLSQEKWIRSGEKIIVYFKKGPKAKNISIGDMLICYTSLDSIKNYGNPNEFDYKKYMAYKGISRQLFLAEENWKIIDSNQISPILELSNALRNYWLNVYRQNDITGDHLAVISAMTLGMRDNIDNDIKSSYINSGALHILAVSGLHVGIIYLFFGSLLAFIKKYKWGEIIHGVLLLLIVWFYALVAGFSVSIFRAATMFTFIIIGESLRRKANTFNSIFVSAFVILLVNPFSIASVGFQLSYMAVIGIVFYQPRLYKLLNINNWLIDKIYQLITVSIAAQLGVLPLILFYFHQFANYFLFVNILIIPFAFMVVFLGLAMLLLSFFSPVVQIIAWVTDHILFLLNKVVVFFAQLPFSVSNNLYVNKIEVILIYLIIISLTIFLILRKNKYLMMSFFSTFLFLFLNGFQLLNRFNNREIMVYNCNSGTIINVIDGKKNIMLCSENMYDKRNNISKWYKENWLKKGTGEPVFLRLGKCNGNICGSVYVERLCGNNCVMQFMNKRLLVLNDKDLYECFLEGHKKLIVDQVIVTNNVLPDIHKLNNMFRFKEIIIDSSNGYYTKEKWIESCRDNKINIHVISLKGAFCEKVFEKS